MSHIQQHKSQVQCGAGELADLNTSSLASTKQADAEGALSACSLPAKSQQEQPEKSQVQALPEHQTAASAAETQGQPAAARTG